MERETIESRLGAIYHLVESRPNQALFLLDTIHGSGYRGDRRFYEVYSSLLNANVGTHIRDLESALTRTPTGGYDPTAFTRGEDVAIKYTRLLADENISINQFSRKRIQSLINEINDVRIHITREKAPEASND